MNTTTETKLRKMNQGFSTKLEYIRISRREEIARIDDYYNKKQAELQAALDTEIDNIINGDTN